jgi:hypothetical protein
VIRRRRSLPPHLLDRHRAFEAVVPDLERAKAALTQAVPGTRLPGRPLAEVLAEFEEGLRTVRRGMDAWRAPEVEEAWQRADRGLDRALAIAERVRLTAEEPSRFEGLIGLVGKLLEPLEPFAEAADRFRQLRAGRGRPSP